VPLTWDFVLSSAPTSPFENAPDGVRDAEVAGSNPAFRRTRVLARPDRRPRGALAGCSSSRVHPTRDSDAPLRRHGRHAIQTLAGGRRRRVSWKFHELEPFHRMGRNPGRKCVSLEPLTCPSTGARVALDREPARRAMDRRQHARRIRNPRGRGAGGRGGGVEVPHRWSAAPAALRQLLKRGSGPRPLMRRDGDAGHRRLRLPGPALRAGSGVARGRQAPRCTVMQDGHGWYDGLVFE
jgi:hypothetical protein